MEKKVHFKLHKVKKHWVTIAVTDYIIKFPDVQFLAFIKARQQDIFSMELSSLSSLVLSAFPGHGPTALCRKSK